MFVSLSSRVAAIGLIVIGALAALAGLFADSTHQSGNSLRWLIHSAEVVQTTEAAMGELRDAESGMRGFVLTHNPSYASLFEERIASASSHMAHVVKLTTDNPPQHARAREIADLFAKKSTVQHRIAALGRRGDFAGAAAVVASGTGREIMDTISVRAKVFLDEERMLQMNRRAATETSLARGKWMALAGAALVALAVAIAFWFLMRAIRSPLEIMMQAMTGLGSGERKIRINTEMGSREFTRLAQGYNAMADQLELAVADRVASEERLQVANAELHRNSEALRARGDMIELLGDMAHRMQAVRTDDELSQIIQVFVPRVLPEIPGILYAYNNSRNLLVPIAGWGGLDVGPDSFAPDQCWALRRGQSHFVLDSGSEIVCGHAEPDQIYHCEPLLAGGEVIGVLYLRGRVEGENRFRLTLLTENISSALVNHRLQRSLREQTIRDPLTGLFNRRYMEEALTLEIARAARSRAPLSLVMCDVDHFKRFNDDFGHEAGDAILQAVAAEMKSRFRDGDVICRFGGEEFTVIAPGTTAEALMDRVEVVRHAIGELNVKQNGRTLGATTMSFGIATWTPGMASDGSALIQAADAALYQAKREGRNRAVITLAA